MDPSSKRILESGGREEDKKRLKVSDEESPPPSAQWVPSESESELEEYYEPKELLVSNLDPYTTDEQLKSFLNAEFAFVGEEPNNDESCEENSQRKLKTGRVWFESLEATKKEEETTEKKKECCYDTKDAFGNNERTIFVTGFDTSGSRDEIRSALAKHFSSCGELIRVFVPIECKTGVAIGHAFIDLLIPRFADIEAALSLDGSDLGGRKLLVTMARIRGEYHYRRNFKGCETCHAILAARRRRRDQWILRTGGGKCIRMYVNHLNSDL